MCYVVFVNLGYGRSLRLLFVCSSLDIAEKIIQKEMRNNIEPYNKEKNKRIKNFLKYKINRNNYFINEMEFVDKEPV
jgi:predicted GTPase